MRERPGKQGNAWIWEDLGKEQVGGRGVDAGRRTGETGELVPSYTVGDQAGQRETALELVAEVLYAMGS